MTTKPTKGLSFPTGNPTAELRELMLEESRRPVSPPESPTVPEPERVAPPTENPEISARQLDSKTERQKDRKIDSKSESNTHSKSDSMKVGERARQKVISAAKTMGASPMKSVGLKMPEELHDWLDDSQHRLKKQGVLKQDLLRRALQLLVIEMETEGWKGDALD